MGYETYTHTYIIKISINSLFDKNNIFIMCRGQMAANKCVLRLYIAGQAHGHIPGQFLAHYVFDTSKIL